MTELTREETIELILSTVPVENQAEALEAALEIYGEAPQTARFEAYKFDPVGYIEKFLGWEPWNGSQDAPGQIQIIDAYTHALRQQFERRDYEHGKIKKNDLHHWQPGEVIKNYIRVEAGHTTGKTKTESGLVNHFLDCFKSVVMMYGPSQDTLKDNLWQELLVDRRGTTLPGKILDSMEIRVGDNHYAKCRVTSDAHGKGSEKLQGKHGEFLMFILDEAEGIADYVFEAIDSMASGGIVIVIMVANPKTRTSKFHKMQSVSNVKSFRMSCLNHPNVVAGREIVPGAVRRHYVEMMVEKHCDVVREHSDEDLTFTLPYQIQTKDRVLPSGTIFRPKFEFMFRVLGVAPPNMSEKTVIPFGVYDAARKRLADNQNPQIARLGVDCARWGIDSGTLYTNHAGAVHKVCEFPQQDTFVYWEKIKKECLRLRDLGVTSLHVRIDGGGGFGSGPTDLLKKDIELQKAFIEFKVFEVQFGSTPKDQTKYADLITELYFETAESLRGLAVENPPEILEIELTERQYDWINSKGKALRKLESKDDFKERKKTKSPDDGDGAVLSIAPDYCFREVKIVAPVSFNQVNRWDL